MANSKIAENVVFSEEGDKLPMCETIKIEVPNLENGENNEFIVLQAETSSTGTDETIGAVSTVSEEASEELSEVVSVDDGKYKSGYEKLPEDATLMERLAYGGKVTLIGMATVFLALIIIWALCTLMGKIFGGKGDTKPKADKKEETTSNKNEAQVTSASPVVSSADYTTVAVVASAAIAAYRGEDTVNFNISSIRPCGNGAVALAPEVVAQIAASIACLEGKDTIDFTISSIRII